jgi:hypothetical protein
LIKHFLVASLLLTSPALFGQSAPAAEGPGGSIWVGAEASSFNPDWGCKGGDPFSCASKQLIGVAGFTDVNRLLGPLGLEGEVRFSNWRGPGHNVSEANYLAGPRYQLLAKRRVSVNLKVLAGMSTFHAFNSWGAWTSFAPGGTVGYRLTRRLMVRGDYEYQIWPDFVGANGPNGLTPNGFSAGLSYRLFR